MRCAHGQKPSCELSRHHPCGLEEETLYLQHQGPGDKEVV